MIRLRMVSPSLSHRLNVLALVLVTLIVLTGGAVRLTGSGLGCSDWPECSVGHLTPALQFHGLIEFGNRLVTVVLTIAVGAALLAAVFRRPHRRDLVYLSLGLVLGIVAQAVLGGMPSSGTAWRGAGPSSHFRAYMGRITRVSSCPRFAS